ncbi:MAG: hypothetical protein PF503_10105 [Desulfobacula sp.]|jgi:hypothetical protein|nr:hypothetical protein [Desulfobacula sp.]
MHRSLLKRALIISLFIILTTSNSSADCRGCCYGHGGIVCIDAVTRCVDGTTLSDKCKTKDCSVCEEPTASDNTIKIASFNIQVFGRSKASKPEVMEVLSSIISQFDIVAIQGIRDKSGTAIKDFLEYCLSKKSWFNTDLLLF